MENIKRYGKYIMLKNKEIWIIQYTTENMFNIFLIIFKYIFKGGGLFGNFMWNLIILDIGWIGYRCLLLHILLSE